MSLRDVMAFIQKRQCASHAGAADTPDTPVKPVGYHLKPAWTGACTPDTPDTPVLCETQTLAQTGQRSEASNDASATDAATPAPMPWLSVHQPWRTADRLYEAHHWQCPACRAAARGRCTERCPEGQRLHDAYTLASSAALNESNP